jgi:RNA polymerase sigma factor (sigma-70 family)
LQRAQAGCLQSLARLMRQHDGLVQAVVRQQYLGDLPFAEALQAGRLGLWRALLGFDPRRGTAFSTYAWPAIMRHVWQAVKSQDHLQHNPPPPVRAPHPLALDPAALAEVDALHQALDDLVQRLPQRLRDIVVFYYGLNGDPPTSYRQLGARLGLSHERIHQLHTEALVWLRHPAHSQTLRTLLHRHTAAEYEEADALAQRWLRKRAGRHGR